MNRMLLFHIALTAIVGLIVWHLYGQGPGLSILAGGATMLLNLLALVYTWPRILAKKSVALSIAIIVFKFAILGWIIYEVVRGQLIQVGWFAVGMAFVVPTVLFSALQSPRQKA